MVDAHKRSLKRWLLIGRVSIGAELARPMPAHRSQGCCTKARKPDRRHRSRRFRGQPGRLPYRHVPGARASDQTTRYSVSMKRLLWGDAQTRRDDSRSGLIDMIGFMELMVLGFGDGPCCAPLIRAAGMISTIARHISATIQRPAQAQCVGLFSTRSGLSGACRKLAPVPLSARFLYMTMSLIICRRMIPTAGYRAADPAQAGQG